MLLTSDGMTLIILFPRLQLNILLSYFCHTTTLLDASDENLALTLQSLAIRAQQMQVSYHGMLSYRFCFQLGNHIYGILRLDVTEGTVNLA